MKLVTHYDQNMKQVGDLCVRSLRRQAPAMGAEVVVDESLRAGRHPSWDKIPVMLATAKRSGTGEVLVWIDADCLLLRPLPLVDHLLSFRTESVFFPSQDWNGICLAVFAMLNVPRAVRLLETLYFCGDVSDNDEFGKGLGPKWEQGACKSLIKRFPEVASMVSALPAAWVTDHPERDPSMSTFIHHFGARTMTLRHQMMNQPKYAHYL